MTYSQDHLAWQQRINQEVNANSHFVENKFTRAPPTASFYGQ